MMPRTSQRWRTLGQRGRGGGRSSPRTRRPGRALPAPKTDFKAHRIPGESDAPRSRARAAAVSGGRRGGEHLARAQGVGPQPAGGPHNRTQARTPRTGAAVLGQASEGMGCRLLSGNSARGEAGSEAAAARPRKAQVRAVSGESTLHAGASASQVPPAVAAWSRWLFKGCTAKRRAGAAGYLRRTRAQRAKRARRGAAGGAPATPSVQHRDRRTTCSPKTAPHQQHRAPSGRGEFQTGGPVISVRPPRSPAQRNAAGVA